MDISREAYISREVVSLVVCYLFDHSVGCPHNGGGQINRSKESVYIENQFFISSLGNEVTHEDKDDDLIQNEIVSALADRIIRAIGEGSKFKV